MAPPSSDRPRLPRRPQPQTGQSAPPELVASDRWVPASQGCGIPEDGGTTPRRSWRADDYSCRPPHRPSAPHELFRGRCHCATAARAAWPTAPRRRPGYDLTVLELAVSQRQASVYWRGGCPACRWISGGVSMTDPTVRHWQPGQAAWLLSPQENRCDHPDDSEADVLPPLDPLAPLGRWLGSAKYWSGWATLPSGHRMVRTKDVASVVVDHVLADRSPAPNSAKWEESSLAGVERRCSQSSRVADRL
jgi:hypothetical protein